MRNPFSRVQLWTLLWFTVPFIIFYNQRHNLTAAFVAKFVTELHWLPGDWIYSELVMGLLGAFCVCLAWTYNRIYGWRRRSEPTKELAQLDATLKTLSANMATLNENIYNQFKYFNPVLERDNIRFDMSEVGKITLREAAIKAEQKENAIAEKKKELQDLEDIEIAE